MNRTSMLCAVLSILTSLSINGMLTPTHRACTRIAQKTACRELHTRRIDRKVKINLLYGTPEHYKIVAPIYRLPRTTDDNHSPITTNYEITRLIECQKNHRRSIILKSYGLLHGQLVKTARSMMQNNQERLSIVHASEISKREVLQLDVIHGAIHLVSKRSVSPSRISYIQSCYESDEGGFNWIDELEIGVDTLDNAAQLQDLKHGIVTVMLQDTK